MTTNMQIPEVFSSMAQAGWKVADFPGKILDKLINDHRGSGGKWRIIVNGNKSMRTYGVDGTPVKLTPFSAVIYWNGWPAGIIDMTGGVIAAGEGANEDALIESIKACGVKAQTKGEG